MPIGHYNSNKIVDKVLESELTNPRLLAWSVIIKDGQPVYNNDILRVSDKITALEQNSLNSNSSSENSKHFLSPRSKEIRSKKEESDFSKTDGNFLCKTVNVESGINEINCNIVKKDFSIWRCLYWPEIAINPIYSGGYGKMRIALCLNKIITSLQEKNQNRGSFGRVNQEKGDHIELLPYVRILYNKELLFQSCIVKKNICIILEIEVHHPLSRIIIEIYDLDDSDPSLINSNDDMIGYIIIPVGAHSNRKPLESRLIIASDDDARILYIRKSQQKKVHNENLMAQKLLRFPIKSCERQLNKNEPEQDRFSEFKDEEDMLGDDPVRNFSKESLDGYIMNELPNSIYFELANQMVKDAIEFSHSAEIKYKSIRILQEPHCSFVIQVFSEIKWSRLSIIPREIIALYLPEPEAGQNFKYNNNSKNYSLYDKKINNDINLEINIKSIINSIILLKEIYDSECVFPYKEYIWKLLNWESQLHSLFALSIIWYLSFNPKYIFSFVFSLGLIILFISFDKRNLALNLESSVSKNLKTLNSLEHDDELLEDNVLYSPIKNNNHTKLQSLSPNSIIIDSYEAKKSVESVDFTILENLLTSQIFSRETIKYINKLSYILEKSVIFIHEMIKLHFWNNSLKSLVLTCVYSVLLLISLTYSNEFCKYMQYFFLIIILLPSTYFLPQIKGIMRIIKSYKKFKRLKR
ncbi:unnamed protein product [Cryptosporidium hominis]|uniref:Uncharacterized protein n=1 Tax=Cryptosporidium hominis TaxID=237895 RepID=A0A0S4TFS0_CRYHO|nr:putative integral membrane protein [Cryptosporidium hominis]PPA64585.1 hypothetical protein ChUKH1_03445 [Cryptosporidium hominis]PPS96867.1 Uncharacterized protein GY17_00001515 [Cryptosporidium hominis]CUV06312.1 unnamed protein product [Cryptosporidium hominis]|eukprot:PPS96867.1 Uncharacterized protein GY17_00001515 [Cryptosporidium hominis]